MPINTGSVYITFRVLHNSVHWLYTKRHVNN
jgi:hypothetical protein